MKFRLSAPHFRNTGFSAVRQVHEHLEDKTIQLHVMISACLSAFCRPCIADLNSRPIVHEIITSYRNTGTFASSETLHAANNYITPLLASPLVKDSWCSVYKYRRHNRCWKTNYGRSSYELVLTDIFLFQAVIYNSQYK